MNTVKLNKSKHNRTKFDCGVKALNNYLCQMANQQSKKDSARTYIIECKNDSSLIIGFYTLTMISLNLNSLSEKLQNKHKNATTAGLIARLAIDKKYKNNGFGQWLLIDALRKLLTASETVGFPLVIVDAKDGAVAFYQKFGFTSFRHVPEKLFITISDIRKSIK